MIGVAHMPAWPTCPQTTLKSSNLVTMPCEDKIRNFIKIRLSFACLPPFQYLRDTISMPKFAIEGRGAPGVKSNIKDVDLLLVARDR